MIRQFQPEDAPSCSKLIHACLDDDSSFSPALCGRIRSGETPPSMIERARLFYVAVYESENRILGVAGLDLNEIRLLCVSPEHRRRGIGRAFIEHFLTMVPAILFSDIFVYSSAAAVGFYKACGFTEEGPVCFDLDGELLSTFFMTFRTR
jgi:GNAT superfamily N-acetyltransferase